MHRHRNYYPALALALALAGYWLPLSIADAFDAPRRKTGLWEISTQTSTSPGSPRVIQQCIDAATDDMFEQLASSAAKDMCSKTDLRREGDKIIGESVCKLDASTATTRSEFSGDYQSAYSGDTSVKYAPALMGISQATIKMSAKWLGPCKPEQKPGDMVMPDGRTINLKGLTGAK